MKTEQGKLHEVVRIKTQECDKLMQYVSGLERIIINMKEGRFQKIHEFVYNQSDHIRVAQISQNVQDLQKTTSSMMTLMNSIIERMDRIPQEEIFIQGVNKLPLKNNDTDNHAALNANLGSIQGDQNL